MVSRLNVSPEARNRITERLAASNPGRHFGFVLETAEQGRVVLRMPVLELHKQMQRVVHGGVVATLADTTGGLAVLLGIPPDSMAVTVELKINFLESVREGEIRADAKVLRQGRTICVAECEITDDRQRLIAKALMTFAIIPNKKP